MNVIRPNTPFPFKCPVACMCLSHACVTLFNHAKPHSEVLSTFEYGNSVSSERHRRAWAWRKGCLHVNYASVCGMVCFYLRHQQYCEPYVFSCFAVCEWVFVGSNMAFLSAIFLDGAHWSVFDVSVRMLAYLSPLHLSVCLFSVSCCACSSRLPASNAQNDALVLCTFHPCLPQAIAHPGQQHVPRR